MPKKTVQDKLFTKNTLILTLIGIAVNLVLARVALHYDLPVFLDTIGTILVASLGGYLPGIVVGFVTNATNSFADMVNMYYGLLNIIISVVASFLAERGVFKKLWQTLLSTFLFAFIGGFLGTLISWMLYGMNFGSGISVKYAQYLYDNQGFDKFTSLAVADYIIDIGDKLIAVVVVFVVLKCLSKKAMEGLPLGYVYLKGPEYKPVFGKSKPGSLSIQTKVTIIMIASLGILGTSTFVVGLNFYENNSYDYDVKYCNSALSLVEKAVDVDNVEKFLDDGIETEEYKVEERNLLEIKKSFPTIEYLYVYKIENDGCHVIFDMDTAEVEASSLGTVIPFDNAFMSLKDRLLEGEEISPIVSNGRYGWLQSVYKPLVNSRGECVAYAGVDITMHDVMIKRYEFAIRMISVLMGVTIFLAALAIWYSRKKIVYPLVEISDVSGEFAHGSEEDRNIDLQRLKNLDINTGDEIEELYHSVTKSFEEIMQYIEVVRDKNSEISKLQDNIIMSFAEMVENRDSNTGFHIKNTAVFVEILGKELLNRGYYPEVLTEEYLEDMVKSAPLHDIGKIKISDAILNKPGRLTTEEFEDIKTHTTAGAEILQNALKGIEESNYLAIAIQMARSHHEKWDGSGYPQGLAGKEIPLCARIMAVADVYDALISKRSYKESLTHEEAMEIIKSESETHFDAEIIEVFDSIGDKIKEKTEG